LNKIAYLAHYPAPLAAVVCYCFAALWLPVAAPIYWLGRDLNSVSILTMLLLLWGNSSWFGFGATSTEPNCCGIMV